MTKDFATGPKMKLKFSDPIRGLTHFIGMLLSILGLVLLLTRRSLPFTAWHAVSFSIYGAAMISLFTCSTLYHWLPVSGKVLGVFRRIDHIMIFVFIAATYTPACLTILRGGWGWAFFGTVWGLTLAGLFLKLFWLHAPRFLYVSVYILAGWMGAIGIWPLLTKMDPRGIVWLVIGGLFYTVGAVIYARKKPDPWPKVFGFHEIFHILIMLGCFSHYLMIYCFI